MHCVLCFKVMLFLILSVTVLLTFLVSDIGIFKGSPSEYDSRLSDMDDGQETGHAS
jgi:hypothetical protein